MRILGVCPTGKISYLDDTEALLALERLSREHDGNVKTERAYYHCTECGFLHLTSWEVPELPLWALEDDGCPND